jgi:hypothetical protein
LGQVAQGVRSIASIDKPAILTARAKIDSVFDAWGVLSTKTASGQANAIETVAPMVFSAKLRYRYTADGQLLSVSFANESADESSIVSGTTYDERGNSIYAKLGNGEETLRAHRRCTNRPKGQS